MKERYCQSCGMPMQAAEDYGTNADGSKRGDYCKYCMENGSFTMECTMEEMIDFCAKTMAEANPGMTEEQARGNMRKFFPTLKRWSV